MLGISYTYNKEKRLLVINRRAIVIDTLYCEYNLASLERIISFESLIDNNIEIFDVKGNDLKERYINTILQMYLKREGK